MPARNPFGDEPFEPGRRNPFEDEDGDIDPIGVIENASRKIRRLRSQLGAEGMTLSGMREMIDEITKAFDATARALKELRYR